MHANITLYCMRVFIPLRVKNVKNANKVKNTYNIKLFTKHS